MNISKLYHDLVKDYGKNQIDFCFGGLGGLKSIIKEGAKVSDLYTFLDAPIEDWQMDC